MAPAYAGLRDIPLWHVVQKSGNISMAAPTGGSWTDLFTWFAAAAKSLQSCPTLCDPMDCSLPGSSIHGIFQARVLEWVAIAFS